MEYGAKPLAISIFFVLVALIWTFPLQHVIAYPFVFLFFGAVMASAWFGGFIAGSWAIVLSSVLIAFFFMPPLYSIAVDRELQSYYSAFIVCAVAITAISGSRKRAENAIRTARDQLEAKVQERTAELLQSNLEIQESARQLRMLTEAIPQQIWRADAAGQIEYCNQHLRDYTGKSGAELSGDAFFGILHPQDAPLYLEGWRDALATGSRFEVDARLRGADGVYRWFLARSSPQRSEDGRIARWYGTHIDIEQQHRAQQNLVLAHEELAGLAHTMSMAEMAASIAHELNQPLTAVVTHAYACREWLRGDPANTEKAAATAEKIVQESTRASSVVSRVRALFRKGDLVREPVDLNRLIEDLVRVLRDEAIRREISIRLDLTPTLPRLNADPIQIQQLLRNLVVNGMEAMAKIPAPCELHIQTAMRGENEVFVSVRDHGAGVPPEVAPRIFEPFFSTRPHGTGMGLAISRSIVEAHGGRLWVENASSGGAVFSFTLRMQP
jgi:PAS domain S-box-containing protein